VPDHDVLFGASLGQWNGADAADAAGRIRLGTQADRDGLDLFTVADLRTSATSWTRTR
jgi:hypothetical protein